MFLLGMLLCANLCAQNYSDEVSLVQMDGDESVTLLATATGEKKKDAADLATKSAFNALLHSGVEGVKNGVAMMASEPKGFTYRFFSESRYISYISGEVETTDTEKIAGHQRVTVRVTIRLKSLRAELLRNNATLNPGWSDAKAVNATAALTPTIVVVPAMKASEGYSFAAMRAKVEAGQLYRSVIDQVTSKFQDNGYKTRDFISQLQNSTTSSLLQSDNQTDDATMLVQQLPGDIVVTVDVSVVGSGNSNECTLSLRAVEKQTSGNLATASFPGGRYMTKDSIRLATYAVEKIQQDFFTRLDQAFQDMVSKGREVFIEVGLSQSVTEWDFDQDSPGTGDFFKDALDEWLRAHSFQGVYDMSNSTAKYINIRLNIPLWNTEKNRSYTLSNFGSEVRKFFKEQLGDDYKATVTAMGQKLVIKVE